MIPIPDQPKEKVAIKCQTPADFREIEQFLLGKGFKWFSGTNHVSDSFDYYPVFVFIDEVDELSHTTSLQVVMWHKIPIISSKNLLRKKKLIRLSRLSEK